MVTVTNVKKRPLSRFAQWREQNGNQRGRQWTAQEFRDKRAKDKAAGAPHKRGGKTSEDVRTRSQVKSQAKKLLADDILARFQQQAGHLPRTPSGDLIFSGKVGSDVTVEQAYDAARLAAINCLASIKEAIGDLDAVKQILKLFVMVNAIPEFERHFVVANGASDLLVELYGNAGRHARSAVGMGGLPRGSCVEVEMVVEIIA